MKDIRRNVVDVCATGYCAPQIAQIARKLKEPSTTIHYNIKRLESEGIIKAYKAVYDYKKIDLGFCAYVLISLSADGYGDPEKIAKELSKNKEIESVDIITGNWELLIKVRTKDQDAYYHMVKHVLRRQGIVKITSLISLKQVKTEFILTGHAQ
jgi:Lrp/AsnC family transcriptional regulator, leucine-responsive regulatory protein